MDNNNNNLLQNIIGKKSDLAVKVVTLESFQLAKTGKCYIAETSEGSGTVFLGTQHLDDVITNIYNTSAAGKAKLEKIQADNRLEMICGVLPVSVKVLIGRDPVAHIDEETGKTSRYELINFDEKQVAAWAEWKRVHTAQ